MNVPPPTDPEQTASSGRADGQARAGTFFVPRETDEWDRLLVCVDAFVRREGLVPPLAYDELEAAAARLIEDEALPASYREFLMVTINNALWRDVVAAIPYPRRTLLLPPCLRSSAACPAAMDEYGLLCEQCGACCIGPLSARAEALGYAVLVAEGTSLVGRLIEQGQIDAVIGVSCMPALERTFPRMAARAVPGIAVPLLMEGCRDTRVYVDWVRALIERYRADGARYLDLKALHATVQGWFEPGCLKGLLEIGQGEIESIALAWLTGSGKRFRPLLVAAVYLALCDAEPETMPLPIRKLALAVECIHKASLIYDDIQDDDALRYGEQTVHARHGIPIALTGALFLLGLGYRLIADCGAAPECRAAMLLTATQAHCDSCLGQGADLGWMRHPTPLTPDEALAIFRLKTAPSFDVVFRLPALCGGADEVTLAVLRKYSAAVGIAYQVRDDLEDFAPDAAGDDIRAGRPSIVMALAYARASEAGRALVADAWRPGGGPARLDDVRAVIAETGAADAARAVLERYRNDALAALRPLRKRDLKILLHRIVGMLLA
jgi:geranylgeranyl diphosphate synthase, type II